MFVFPKTHSLVRLIDLLEEKQVHVPDLVKSADILTHYAVETRYPGLSEEITADEYSEALRLAQAVLSWAEGVISAKKE